MEAVRVDKWVWAARFCKTRGDATEAVAAGHVRVTGAGVKPARDVVVGDRLDIALRDQRWTVVVTGLAERRSSAAVAATLYEETPGSGEERERRRAERRLARPLGAELPGRPTKRDRRRLDALRRAQRGPR